MRPDRRRIVRAVTVTVTVTVTVRPHGARVCLAHLVESLESLTGRTARTRRTVLHRTGKGGIRPVLACKPHKGRGPGAGDDRGRSVAVAMWTVNRRRSGSDGGSASGSPWPGHVPAWPGHGPGWADGPRTERMRLQPWK